MIRQRWLKAFGGGVLAALGVLLVVALAPALLPGETSATELGGEAAPAEAESPQVQASPLRILVIPAADFRDDGLIPDSHYFPFLGGYQQGTDAHYGCVMAPAYLPNRVELAGLYASVYDNAVNDNMLIQLRRLNNLDGTVDLMAQTSTEGAHPAVVIISNLEIEHASILYPDYSYYVTTCLVSPDSRLYSVRLYFSYPWAIHLPFVIK
jgi:hypothetical protein